MVVENVAIGMLIFAAVGIVGVLVFSNFYDALPVLTGAANTSVVSFANNFYAGVNLLGIALIVMGERVQALALTLPKLSRSSA